MGSSSVVTRFPPSPTGYLHIGGVRTALFNYLFAKHNDGTMYFRFEDTDKERSKKEYEDDIIQNLVWLGISYTSPEIGRQSERISVYQKCFRTLLEKDLAYEAEPSKDDPGKKVIRFRNPNSTITFQDLVRGEVTFKTEELEDFVIARNIDEPLYHLAVVIDDYEMGVTHIIRGEDHISNTPRQILILEALGFPRPHYAHLPLILAPDRSKLSKRHGAVSVNEYRAKGYLPKAIINYLALLGWNPGTDQELFSKEELVKVFDFSGIQKHGAIFNEEKLRWFNREYLLKMSIDEFAGYVTSALKDALATRGITNVDAMIPKLIPVIREHISTTDDLVAMAREGEFDYYFKKPVVDATRIPYKTETPADAVKHLRHVRDLLVKSSVDIFEKPDDIKVLIWDYATEAGRGAVLWPLRYALTGTERSPDPFTVMSILGRDETVARIDTACALLKTLGTEK